MERFYSTHSDAVDAVLAKWSMCVAVAGSGDSRVPLWDTEALNGIKDRITEQAKSFKVHVEEGDEPVGELVSWTIDNGNFFIEQSNIVSPFMYTFDGTFPIRVTEMDVGVRGFDEYYSNILPALMVNRLIPAIQNIPGNTITTHVLCQGNGFTLDKKWWDYADDGAGESTDDERFFLVCNSIVESIGGSSAFKKIFTDLRMGFGEGKSVQ